MILGDFLKELLENGQPVFESADAPRDLGKPAERTAALLMEMERARRADAPGEAPGFDPEIAHAAAGVLCRLAQFTVFREIPGETIDAEWSELRKTVRPESATPSRIWSADLALTHLPDLFRIVRNVSENDALMKPVRELAKWWPLSGVGVDGVEWVDSDFEVILADESLAGLLVDRVLEKQERSLALIPGIRVRLDAAVGDYRKDLAPWLADVVLLEEG